MNRNELIKDIKNFTGSGLVTRKQLSDYCGKKDPHGVDRYLSGLAAVEGKYYFIPDVCDVLLSLVGDKYGK